MKPTVAKFTKQRPVNKGDIWRALRGRRQYRKSTQIDAVHAVIGLNAPRNMLVNGYLVKSVHGKADVYILTESGKEWLTKGVIAFLRNHPDQRDELQNVPAAMLKEADMR